MKINWYDLPPNEKIDTIAIALKRGLIEYDAATGMLTLTKLGKQHLANLKKLKDGDINHEQ